MKILGIGFLSESSVCLIENGKIKYAISQERINRVKNWWGNPYKAVDFALKETNNKLRDIDIIATHGLSSIIKDVPNKKYFADKIAEVNKSFLPKNKKKNQVKFLIERQNHELKANNRVMRNVIALRKRYNKIEVHDHHKSHAASAYFFSGWSKCYSLTIDGWGDNSSSKLYKITNGKFTQITSTSTIDSLGYFYGSITKLLGFKPHRHEGKILGLSAHGNPNNAYKIISKMISYDKNNKTFKGNFEKGYYLAKYQNPNISFLKKKFSREDIAAAAQKRTEEVILEFIKDNVPYNSRLALAGGVFSNVKINQKISELKNIREIYVFPNMGDGGLSVGSAMLSYNNKKKFRPQVLKDMYLGPRFSNKDILKILKKSRVTFFKKSNPSKFIADKLNKGFVVACFQGRMEFGPRSLGNRSILVNAKRKNINDWLNKKLKRTEFMPFAPITLDKYAKEMYKSLDNKKKASKFMTVTLNCTNKALNLSPAAVHIDKTARPQIIKKSDNLKIYNILYEYFKISKIPNLINTSFNVHEEPIVCNPVDAIKAFKESRLDFLYIGDYVVEKNDRKIR